MATYNMTPEQMANLTPEQMAKLNAQLSKLSTYRDERDDLESQLAQAHSLQRNAFSEDHRTGLAGALGGIAGIINTAHGAMDEGKIRARQGILRADKQSGTEEYGRNAMAAQAAANRGRDAGNPDSMAPLSMSPMEPPAAPMTAQARGRPEVSQQELYAALMRRKASAENPYPDGSGLSSPFEME